jgi:hypothetical protein
MKCNKPHKPLILHHITALKPTHPPIWIHLSSYHGMPVLLVKLVHHHTFHIDVPHVVQSPLLLASPHSDFKPYITTHINDIWQISWNNKVNNKLFEITPTLKKTCMPSTLTSRDEVVLCRARIGHTHLTHSYLLKGEDQPECIPCQCALTVKHSN